METHNVNKRALENEELLQIIREAEGIYEATLIKLLQCNRIGLEGRLKTLQKHKWIKRHKLSKHFYYAKRYDLLNLKSLDLQANALQKILSLGFNTGTLTIRNLPQKQVITSLFSPTNVIYQYEKVGHEASIHELYEKCLSDENKHLFLKFIRNFLIKVPLKISSIYGFTTDAYYTTSLNALEILAIPDESQLSVIQGKLKDMSYYQRVDKNTDFIRHDMLIYIEATDSLFYFVKNQNRKYQLVEIHHIFELVYYLSNFFAGKGFLAFSEDENVYKALNKLYKKSLENRTRYNTMARKQEKKKHCLN
ncbi:Uncharacterised protein [Enterococcus hirae]|uniref:hypothetical protein n=1 Tax=Enterococcus hirae TaxID=1354 RepID=UPI0010267137|nr:hypothetical protein [Enterococcus hirae]VFA57520.1 Uncharacterised protein [Enterococcus hirae]VTS66966.1 Uncharacterised protein [Enterococcus hirae]